jgi:hypothetical protein
VFYRGGVGPTSKPQNMLQPTPQDILANALQWRLGSTNQTKPTPALLIAALQSTERSAKRAKDIDYDALLGTWRLCCVADQKKHRGTKRNGAKRKVSTQWIPDWLQIQITYTRDILGEPGLSSAQIPGSVHNSVQLGLLTLTLNGPTLFNATNGILAFDFTHLNINLAGRSLYSGPIRGGASQESVFYGLSLKQQAFFRFFWISPLGLAARGKGGGLALWTKSSQQ